MEPQDQEHQAQQQKEPDHWQAGEFEELVWFAQAQQYRQDRRAGYSIEDWLMVLTDKVGELNRVVLEYRLQGKQTTYEQRQALIHVAAVCRAIWHQAEQHQRPGL